MATLPKPYITTEQYLAIERNAERRSEYFNGEMFLMAGGSKKHARIKDNVTVSLGVQLADKPCVTYSSDLRLYVASSGLYTYPDIMIVCQPEESSPHDPDASITNPTVIIEILSPSTEDYDRGRKFRFYQQLSSLRDYLLISQDQIWVEHFAIHAPCEPTACSYRSLNDVLELPSIACCLSLRDIYHKTDLAAA